MNISYDTGKLVLRLALGILVLLHGVSKIIAASIRSSAYGRARPAS